MRKWMIVAGVALLAAMFFLLRGGGNPSGVPVREDALQAPGPTTDAGESGMGMTPSALGSIHGVVWRCGRPVASRVELRLLRATDPSLPPNFQTMLPPVFSLQSPFSDRKPARVVSTDPQGLFLIPDVPNGQYEVRARCEDGRTGYAVAHVNKAGQRVRADPEVAGGSLTLRGRARYTDGRAFEGWIDLVVEEEWLGGLMIMHDDMLVGLPPIHGIGARTDSGGRFSISGLEPGPHRISCLREGEFRSVGCWVSVPREAEFVFVVDRGLVALEGQVLAEGTGKPVSGAVVWAAGRAIGGVDALTRGRTDEVGRFSLAVPAECRGILADADGFRPSSFRVPDDTREVTVLLAPAARVAGTVVEKGSDKPAPGVTVFAVTRHEDLGDQILPVEHTVTDAGGRFAFDDLPPGMISFGARGNGWVSPGFGAVGGKVFDPCALTLTSGSEGKLRLEVVRPARVRGTVKDQEGRPVPAAVLRVTQEGQAIWRSPARHLMGSAGTSGAAGEFELRDLIPNLEGEMTVSTLEHGEVRVPIPRIAPGESKEIEVGLVRGLWGDVKVVETKRTGGDLEINGSVRFEDGSVPYRAVVSASGPDDIRLDRIPVDDLGNFRLTGLSGGEFNVRAVAFREKWFDAETRVKAGSSGVALIFKPQEPYDGSGSTPTVFTVLTADGKPVDRGDLVVHYRRSRRWVDDWNWIMDGKATARRPDTREDYWVDVFTARSRSGARLEVGSALVGPIPVGRREVEVRLPAERRVTGFVRDEDGRPVPGVRVFAQPVYPFDIHMPAGALSRGGPRTHSETFAGPDGGFELRWLGDLVYVVKVDVPPEFLDTEPVMTRAGSRGVAITLRPGSTPKVTILDDVGLPVPRASIWLLSLQGGSWDSYRDGADADDHGVVALPGLDPKQKYIIRVSPPDDRPSLLSLEIKDWAPKDATVRLKEGLYVKGVVRDSDGVPASEAVVHGEEVGRSDTREKRVNVAGDGSFEVGPFHPGKVGLLALPPGASAWDATEKWEKVDAGAEGVRLVLHTRWKLTVRLPGIEEKDRWDLDARLSLDDHDPFGFGWSSRGFLLPDGHFAFRDLEAGKSYSLYVGHPELGLYALQRGITRETPTIDARFSPGQTIRGRILLPPDPPSHGVIATGPGFEVSGEVEEDGTFEIRGVPPGPCSVVAWTRTDASEVRTCEQVEAGESVVLDLRSR